MLPQIHSINMLSKNLSEETVALYQSTYILGKGEHLDFQGTYNAGRILPGKLRSEWKLSSWSWDPNLPSRSNVFLSASRFS